MAIIDKDEKMAHETCKMISDNGGNATCLVSDVTKDEHINQAISEILQNFVHINVLVNNAGVAKRGTVQETTDEELDLIMAVNVKAIFILSRYALPSMLVQQNGSIINVGSNAGLVGVDRMSAYCASKGAVIALTKAMAIDYAPYKIRVNCICPGIIVTEMAKKEFGPELEKRVRSKYPLGRMGLPEEVADLVVYLSSEESSFITGAVIPIDGGMTAQ